MQCGWRVTSVREIRVASEIECDRQAIAPLWESLKAAAQQSRAVFHTPGHKKGQGIASELKHWFGNAMFQADLPELPELDNLFAPTGVIQQAQELAAEIFGADQTWFLANGSTCGIEAAVLATCNPGEKLILPRNAHQSAIAALVLSGAVPVFVEPEYDADWDMAHGMTPVGLELALAQHPDAKAVLLVSPTYHGIVGNQQTIAEMAHQHHIPLLVDEAHGAHFAFHAEFPAPALSRGADLTIQSIHKTLSALTQSAMLHVQGSRIDRDRLGRALQLVQSTSPNYLLLASLDVARQQMATQGKALMEQTLNLAKLARDRINQIAGLVVLSNRTLPNKTLPNRTDLTTGFVELDLTRLTVNVTGLGLTGFEADEILHQTLGVTAELPGLRHLTFIITLGNTFEDIDRLVYAFKRLAEECQRQNDQATNDQATKTQGLKPQTLSSPVLTPRQAFFAPSQPVPIQQAIDRISTELVCPYPPGIPVLFPGERITLEAIDYLQQVLAAGGMVTGCTDPTLQRLTVVKDEVKNQEKK